MSTIRQITDSLRNKLRERNADTDYTNQFLYQTAIEHAKWLIKREISAGRIYKNVTFFQTLSCQSVIETSTIDNCCPIKTDCKIYRTKDKLPEVWIDADGPILKNITSVDGTTDFQTTTPTTWQSKRNDPYNRLSKQKYSFYSDGYLWFPENNPHKVNILGFFTEDISHLNGCSDNEECVRYMDTKFLVPDWILAECIAKSIELLVGVTSKLQNDNQIDKNDTRKN
jgi:hypothetical protein